MIILCKALFNSWLYTLQTGKQLKWRENNVYKKVRIMYLFYVLTLTTLIMCVYKLSIATTVLLFKWQKDTIWSQYKAISFYIYIFNSYKTESFKNVNMKWN